MEFREEFRCEDPLDCGITFDNYDSVDPTSSMIPTVPITPADDIVSSSYQPVPLCQPIIFNQQQQFMGGAEDLAGLSAGLMLPEATGNVSPHMINFNNTEVGGARFSSMACSEQYNFKATVNKDSDACGRGKQFKFDEKTNTVYAKIKKSIPFCFTTGALVPRGCSVRTMVKFASDVVAKQRGPVKRCANHKSEDMQAGLLNVEHFIQSRMEEAAYFMLGEHYCVSVPFDKLVEGVCLFSFACYNSCLEYKDDSSRKGKLVKPALQVVFTLLDCHENILGEDSVDLRACACPTRDAPAVNSNTSCCGNYKLASNGGISQSIRQKLKSSAGSKHHHRVRRMQRKSSHHKQQLSLQSLVQQVQQVKGLDKDDVIDDKAGLYKFTCSVKNREQYQILCTLRAAFQQQ